MSEPTNLPPAIEVRSGGQTLHVRRLGSGPRLLLLHGGPGLDHHLVLPLGVPLSRSFEVWLPDLPGHGRSHERDAGLPDLSSVLERTARWFEKLDPQPEVIAGHSLGAWLAREMLCSGRVRPRAAVLISPPAAAASGRPAARQRPRETPPRRERALREELLELLTEDVAAEPSAEMVDALARARLRPPETYTALHRQLQRALGGPIPPCRPGCPVLLLCGDADRVGPPEALARLGAATAGSVVRVLPGSGHFPFAAGAEPVVEAILEFLSSSGAARPRAARN